MKRAALLLTGMSLLMTSVALAHPGHEAAASADALRAGFAHPWSGLDHVLAMLALGLWALQMGRRSTLVLPLLFPAVMLLGAVLGRGAALPVPLELFIAATVVVLGALIALQARWSLRYSVPVVAVIALAHGFAHGAELPLATSASGYFAGFTLATLLLHGLGIALGLGIARVLNAARVALTVCGGAIASVGLLLFVA